MIQTLFVLAGKPSLSGHVSPTVLALQVALDFTGFGPDRPPFRGWTVRFPFRGQPEREASHAEYSTCGVAASADDDLVEDFREDVDAMLVPETDSEREEKSANGRD